MKYLCLVYLEEKILNALPATSGARSRMKRCPTARSYRSWTHHTSFLFCLWCTISTQPGKGG